MNAQHTPTAGIALSLTIGQHVRHGDCAGRSVAGTIRTLTVEDGALMATIALDQPIVLPARHGFGETRIYSQHVPAHEVAPFDERDEVIEALRGALQAMLNYHDELGTKAADQRLLDAGYAAIARITGATS